MVSSFSIAFLAGLISPVLHRSSWLKPFTLLALVLASFFVASPISLRGFEPSSYGVIFGEILIVVLFAISLYSKRDITQTQILLLLSASIALLQSNSLLSFVISFEAVSLISVVIVSDIQTPKEAEGAVKIFVAGAVATAILMLGVLFYTISGAKLLSPPEITKGVLGVSGVMLILLGVFYKLTIFPMHSWAVDTYSLVKAEYASLLSGVAKSVVVVALFRVFDEVLLGFLEYSNTIFPILIILSIITMTLGNFMALWQNRIGKILAWSSIAQAGYMLIAFVSIKSQFASSGILYMAVAYIFMQSGAFLALGYIRESYGIESLEDIKGLASYDKYISIFFTIYLLSLAGIPLLAGFLGKAVLFYSGVDASLWWLVLIGLLNSALSVGYYVWIIKHIYFDGAKGSVTRVKMSKSVALSQIILVAGTIYFGIFANTILNI